MKNILTIRGFKPLLAILLICICSGCEPDDENLEEALFPNIAEVFIDTFSPGLQYDAFGTSRVTAFDVDTDVAFEGTASMRFDIPNTDDPQGGFAGGVFSTSVGRNLTEYNVLTFYARASRGETINQIGFGLTFEGDVFRTEVNGLQVGTEWQQYFIPIPNGARLTEERGMLFLAEASDDGESYQLFIDEVRFENLSTIILENAQILNGIDQVTAISEGNTITIDGTSATYNLPDGLAQNVTTTAAYFDFTSSNETVATVDEFGVVSTLSDEGSAIISATLDGSEVDGSITFMEVDASDNVDDSNNSEIMLPIGFESTTLPYNPTEFGGAPSSVGANPLVGGLNNSARSLSTQKVTGSEPFAGIFMDLDVSADFSEIQQVTALVFAPAAGTDVLLGFEDGTIGQASQIAVTATTTVGGVWQELTFDYSGLVNQATDYNRLILIYNNGTPGDDSVFFIDDIQLMGDDDGGDPTTDPNNLLQNGDFEQGMVAWEGNGFNVQVEGGNSFNFVDVGAAGNPFDVNLSQRGLTINEGEIFTLTFDASTDAATGSRTMIAGIGLFVDPFTNQTVEVNLTSETQTFTLELTANFSSTDGRVLFDMGAAAGVVVIDNVILAEGGSGGNGGGDTPTEAAPTPVNRDPADVVSLFSNAYTNITVDTFFAGFSQGGAQTNEQVAGDDVLRYADLDFAGVETITAAVDLTGMTDFSIDVWTPTSFDFIAGVVDFGGDGFAGANADTRGDVRETLTAGQWNTITVSIADLQAAGLTGTPSDFSQLILDVVDVTGTVYVDNIFFFNDGATGGGTTPTEAAPTPVNRDPADVVSLFSNAYTNITVDTFFAGFSQGGAQTNEQVAGDDVLRYADLDFAGVETITAAVDLTGMTDFSIDVWTPTSFDFIAGVVDFGGDGFAGANADTRGDVRETLTAGQWNTITVSIADLQAAGLTGTPSDFSQLILDVVDVTGTVYVDNIFFFNDGATGGGTGAALLENGDFEQGAVAWEGNGFNVQTDGGNSFNFVDVAAAGNPFDVNLSQRGLTINDGETFTLTFDASTDATTGSRPMIVGIGLFVDPFTNQSVEVTLTDAIQTFTVELTANFSSTDGRVLFDMGAATGVVVIDNVVLTEGGSGGGDPGNTVTALSTLPADFENGEEFSAVFEAANVNGSITSNVVSGGINTSPNVYTFNKPAGGEFFGGMENVFATPLDLTTTRTFRVQVYSTKPNIMVRFELQTRPDGPNFSIDQPITNANEWVELTFDFGPVTTGFAGFDPSIYNAIVIIPDFDPANDPTTTSETYYIDNIILE